MDKKVLIGIGVVVAIGAVLGLGVAGVIPIPGLSKKPAKVAAADEKKDDPTTDDPKQSPDPKPTPDPKPPTDAKDPKAAKPAVAGKGDEKPKDAGPTPVDLARGYKKLAGVWGEMSPADVSKLLIEHYKPEDAAPILKLMDEDQVAAIFTALAKTEPAPAALGAPVKKPSDNPTADYCQALAKEVSKPIPTDSTSS